MTYSVLLSEEAAEYISDLDDKSQRIVKDNLAELEDDPYPRPEAGGGDREQLSIDGEDIYRLHIGRTYTAFYDVVESENRVHVVEVTTIDDAHKKYDR